ncbi:hypothetical protein COOONC_18041, partial [Cooperia oncophora]
QTVGHRKALYRLVRVVKEKAIRKPKAKAIAHYVSEPTRWTYPDSEIDDPIYIRDNESQSDFEPLPRVDSDYRLAVDTRIEEHFIGIKTSDEAAALVKADDFALYYRKDKNNDVGAAIQLHLVHRNTIDEVFHFPVLRCCEENGSKWWYVQIGNNKMQSVSYT